MKECHFKEANRMKEAPSIKNVYLDCDECGFEWLLPSDAIEVEINGEVYCVCQNSDCEEKLIKRLQKNK